MARRYTDGFRSDEAGGGCAGVRDSKAEVDRGGDGCGGSEQSLGLRDCRNDRAMTERRRARRRSECTMPRRPRLVIVCRRAGGFARVPWVPLIRRLKMMVATVP